MPTRRAATANQTNPDLRTLLAGVRTIAIVGFSANPLRPSNEVGLFLVARGYGCVGVNPGLAGRHIGDMPVVARLADINHPIDMVDISVPRMPSGRLSTKLWRSTPNRV